jgi:hypothetical protein
MAPSMVHVTNPTPGSGGNPRRAYGRRHQLMTAGMVHVMTAGMVHVAASMVHVTKSDTLRERE